MRSVARFARRTLEWLAILASAAAILLAVIIPRIFGGTPYTILTGSMAPAIQPGALVVVRPVDPSTLSVGDVVTVQLESGESTMVTHRIAEIQYRADGQMQFVTKGDANEIVDAEPRMPVQIRGELWYQVPYLGYVSNALTGTQRGWLGALAIAGLAGYAAWMYYSASKERRQAAERESSTAQEPSRVAAGPGPAPGRWAVPRRVAETEPREVAPLTDGPQVS